MTTEQVSWPPSLVTELAERRVGLVVGAGISANSTGVDNQRMPTWTTLLRAGIDCLLAPQSPERALAEKRLDENDLLHCAEILVHESNRPDFDAFIRAQLLAPGFKPARIHEIIEELGAKNIFTTNYDNLIESYCQSGRSKQAYNVVRYYENHFLDDLRSPITSIVKMHGCITHPQKVVLSRTSYFRSRDEFSSFFSIVDALFMTQTLLFLGCGLSDPDLLLLLENSNIKAKTSHPHYAVVPDDVDADRERVLRDVNNIQLLKYPAHDHDKVTDSLEDLLEAVQTWRRTH